MNTDPIENTSSEFAKLPGIGPRQAKRLAYFLLRQSAAERALLARAVESLGSVSRCRLCYRFTEKLTDGICALCASPERTNELMIVETDIDLTNIERTKLYSGRYVVLGHLIPVAGTKDADSLLSRTEATVRHWSEHGVTEVIMGLSATPEGDFTSETLKLRLKANFPSLTITEFARGFASGSEVAYADKETLKHALKGRHAGE